MNTVTIVLRPGLGLDFEAMAPALSLGAPVSIGRGGAVIAALSDENAVERLSALDEKLASDGWQHELSPGLLEMLMDGYEAAVRAGLVRQFSLHEIEQPENVAREQVERVNILPLGIINPDGRGRWCSYADHLRVLGAERLQHAEVVELLTKDLDGHRSALGEDHRLQVAAPKMAASLNQVLTKVGGLFAVLDHGGKPSEQMWEEASQAIEPIWDLMAEIEGRHVSSVEKEPQLG